MQPPPLVCAGKCRTRSLTEPGVPEQPAPHIAQFFSELQPQQLVVSRHPRDTVCIRSQKPLPSGPHM